MMRKGQAMDVCGQQLSLIEHFSILAA